MSYKLNPYDGKHDYYQRPIPELGSAPATGVDGQMYLNTSDSKIYIYFAGTWYVLHELITSFDALLCETGDFLVQEGVGSLVLLDE
jgi:hypothetical protein